MEYRQEQLASFKSEFARRRQRQLVVGGLSAIGLLLVLFYQGGNEWRVPFTLFWLAGLVGVLIFSFQNWRCPACHRYLGKSSNLTFCPKCGVALK
jgi:hypothetical protein